jgi:hypothetical protein
MQIVARKGSMTLFVALPSLAWFVPSLAETTPNAQPAKPVT